VAIVFGAYSAAIEKLIKTGRTLQRRWSLAPSFVLIQILLLKSLATGFALSHNSLDVPLLVRQLLRRST
jgi:hypothetical protein